MRSWVKRRLFSVCWDIGDTFMGWAMKMQGPPDETWTRIDLHKNCLPKTGKVIIQSSTFPTSAQNFTTTTAVWGYDD